MNKKLTTTVSIALLSAVAVTAVNTAPKHANAALGLTTGDAQTAIIGASIAGAAGLATAGIFSLKPHPAYAPLVLFGLTTSAALTLAGIIVLDGSSLEFGHITLTEALEADLTESEWRAYEDELPEISAVSQTVNAELSKLYQRNGTVTFQDAQPLWLKYGTSLSNEAFSAVIKLCAHALKQAQSR
jgi:hypothetical protein